MMQTLVMALWTRTTRKIDHHTQPQLGMELAWNAAWPVFDGISTTGLLGPGSYLSIDPKGTNKKIQPGILAINLATTIRTVPIFLKHCQKKPQAQNQNSSIHI
ncbi:hypothetical protein CHS0354_032841 [Potamilus streckersoni]|uniref:Uncharacterized protein n=1 Tax=Potamilus streckersoni TaxID=2493646 RepID=A0AAE0S9R5_9BIVA|nr:hypothetical protein CHS0354_032841 [Potamilus streckersoni]